MSIVFLFSSALVAEESQPEFIEGTDYTRIVKTHLTDDSDLSELESISNIEVFYWYGCEPCFQVEAALLNYLGENPDITSRRTPVVLRAAWRQQAYLQALTEQLPESAQSLDILDVYQECLQDCSSFSSIETSQKWLEEKQLVEDFPIIALEQVWTTEKMYRKRADLFSIVQVPTIIINETYKVDANQAGSPRRLIKIVDYLLSLD